MWKIKVRVRCAKKAWTERFLLVEDNVLLVASRLPALLKTKFSDEPFEIESFTCEGPEVLEKAAIAAVKKRKRRRRK